MMCCATGGLYLRRKPRGLGGGGVDGKVLSTPKKDRKKASTRPPYSPLPPSTHRLLSSSFLGLPSRILNIKPQKGTT